MTALILLFSLLAGILAGTITYLCRKLYVDDKTPIARGFVGCKQIDALREKLK